MVLVAVGILWLPGLGPIGLSAQQPDSVAPTPSIIRTIRLDRRNVYGEAEATSFLPRLVNGLRVATRPGVVTRELLFEVGEPYDSARVAETERNLRRLGIFRIVRVDTTRVDGGLAVTVHTQDAWSTTPDFTIRSTGTQTAWRVSLVEQNLLGTASLFALSYARDPDRDAFQIAFSQPRLIASQIGVGFYLDDRSDGRILSGQVSQPFLRMESPRAWLVSAEGRDERILRYIGGEPIASDTAQRDLGMFAASLGWALHANAQEYLRLGVGGRIWQDIFGTADSIPASGPTYGAISAGLEWRRARFVVTRGFRASRDEDVDLSTTVRAGLGFTPQGWGYAEHGVVPSLAARAGAVISSRVFGYLDLAAHGRFTAAGLDSGSVQTAATVVAVPAEGHAAVFHAWGGWLHHPRPGGEFDLGLGLGPRGYRLHAYSGDRGVFATAEYRYMAFQDFLKLADIGVAGFVDWGGAWYQGSKVRTGWNLGAGLRFGPSRSTDLFLNRFDLVYRGGNEIEPAGWVVVIGKGLVFSTNGILNR